MTKAVAIPNYPVDKIVKYARREANATGIPISYSANGRMVTAYPYANPKNGRPKYIPDTIGIGCTN